MKKISKKILAVTASIMTMLSGTGYSASSVDYLEKKIDPALVIDENIGYTYSALGKFVADNELTGYVALNSEKLVEVVCYTSGQLDRVKAFAAESGLDDELIVYTVDENMDLSVTDGGDVSLATNEELEQLIIAAQKLEQFIFENGFADDSAYVSLQWYRHAVFLYVKDDNTQNAVLKFIGESGIENSLVDVVLSPEYDFRVANGGQNGSDEVNLIAASEYFMIKKYMNENAYLCNIFLALEHDKVSDTDISVIEVYVRSQDEADALDNYMKENGFWADAVKINVTPDLAPKTDGAVRNKTFITLDGDTNDDGSVNVADIVLLQKYLAGADEINERQSDAANVIKSDSLNVFDLVCSKRKLLDNGSAESAEPDNTEARLREKYPEYFDLGTFKGLEVYVWQISENNYNCILTEGTNRNKTETEIIKLSENSASIDEMKAILSYYDIPNENIFIIPWHNPISSYYVCDKDHCEKLNEMFFGITETISPSFDPKEITSISVSSWPESAVNIREYSSAEKIEKVVSYLNGLHLQKDFPENPNEYNGMTWEIKLDFENGDKKTVYLFGNMFYGEEGSDWLKMDYDEAIAFDNLINDYPSDR